MKKLTLFFILLMAAGLAKAQVPDAMENAIKNDDSAALGKLINKDNINACYGNYSLLSESIREQANNCFDLLVAQGAAPVDWSLT